jgi:arylsulfatase A-like enzyme
VLLVMTDDQGFGDAGFQGNPVLKTPALDALAASGVRFTDFLASPTCSPSRAALMTGRHEFRSGVTHTIEGRNLLRLGVPTMAEAFANAGYRTAIFGKWHLGEPRPFHPLDRGFGNALLVGGGATGQTPDFWGNTMFDPHLQENGEWKPFQGHMTDLFADKALEWISSGTQPWFCYLALNAPHIPLQIGDEWAKPYLDAGLPERLAKFYGMITHLDAALGRMLAGLAKDGVLQNTIVVFLGDNGTALGGDPQPGEFNGGLRGTKGSAYQGGVRIPAVFSWPGRFAEGASVNTLASLCDVLPTLAQACGLDVRNFPEPDGRSLLPILMGGKQPADWTDRVVPTHVARWPSGTPVEKLPFLFASVRDQRHSLVEGRELYDLESDPGESDDIAQKNPEIVERLRKAHLDWWESVRDSAMDSQPFVIGRPGQKAVELTCMDWQPSRATSEPLPIGLWEQETLREWNAGRMASGVDGACGGWLVDVQTPGRYLLEFRSRPRDADEPHPLAKGSVFLAIGGKIFESEISEGAESVKMEIQLPAGRHFLEPVLTGQRDSGLPQGAYFCRIQSPTPSHP